MPVIQIVVNKEASLETKKAVAKGLTELVAAECRVPASHVHVLLLDNQFFSFGDNYEKAAVYVTVRSSAQQIVAEARRNLVLEIVGILTAAFADLDPLRINTFFEELPVENIAVGSNIATFAVPGSNRNSLGGAQGA